VTEREIVGVGGRRRDGVGVTFEAVWGEGRVGLGRSGEGCRGRDKGGRKMGWGEGEKGRGRGSKEGVSSKGRGLGVPTTMARPEHLRKT